MGGVIRLGHALLSFIVLAVAVAFIAPQLGIGPDSVGAARLTYSWPSGAPSEADQWRDAYLQASEDYQVPIDVLLAVSWAESAFQPSAESQVGACGLMQLMPATARSLGVDCWDPVAGIRGGARYLRQQYEAFGSWQLAFAAYNAGPGAVQQYGGVPPYRETRNYIDTIQGYLTKLGDPLAKKKDSAAGQFTHRTQAWWTWAGGELKQSGYNKLSTGAGFVASAFGWAADSANDGKLKSLRTGKYALPVHEPIDPADIETTHHDYPAWDYGIPVGTQLYAVVAGSVTVIGDSSCGNGVRIQTTDGWWWTMCHMTEVTVANGSYVEPGQEVGRSGNTGHSTGPHLHLQARNPAGELVCPQTALAQWQGGDLSADPVGSNCVH